VNALSGRWWWLAVAALAAGCVVTATPAPVAVAPPPRHPAYLRALEDLRHARAHLERPANVTARTAWDEAVAVREIDAALREIRQAAIDDGKPVGYHPPVDVGLDWSGRLRRAVELLERAHQDCAQDEDNAFAQGLQARAIQHIDAALAYVRQGIASNVVQPPPPPPPAPVVVMQGPNHPAYIHALEDLRHARAHLQRPAQMVGIVVAWDEAVAIREIDAAMNEIVRAAINDGKNVNEHPPVDAHMDWRGRLHRTVELLRKARQDCAREEDNAFAQGLQRRAIQHIDGAIAYVQQGIAMNHW
jgi:hypothetical protein